jgi:hypothetical protein
MPEDGNVYGHDCGNLRFNKMKQGLKNVIRYKGNVFPVHNLSFSIHLKVLKHLLLRKRILITYSLMELNPS